MNLSVVLLAVACQLFTLAVADYTGFYFYGVRNTLPPSSLNLQTADPPFPQGSHTGKWTSESEWVAGLYPSLPDCDMINEFPGYQIKGDVSRKRIGVACDGEGCPQSMQDPTKLDRVEINADFGHYSMSTGPQLGG